MSCPAWEPRCSGGLDIDRLPDYGDTAADVTWTFPAALIDRIGWNKKDRSHNGVTSVFLGLGSVEQNQRNGYVYDGGQYDWQEGALGQFNRGEAGGTTYYDHDG